MVENRPTESFFNAIDNLTIKERYAYIWPMYIHISSYYQTDKSKELAITNSYSIKSLLKDEG
jgi:hypothetical protein